MLITETSHIYPHQCAKPGCTRGLIQRHHRGCEAMWLKHFLPQRTTKRYREFRERYYSFHKRDCIPICSWHHEEIHQLYLPIINEHIEQRGHPSIWKWHHARKLIAELRRYCDAWLKLETPGRKPTPRRDPSPIHHEST